MSLIQINSITKNYRNAEFETRVLNGISLVVEEGEYVSIIGPSGAGKSTLMTILGCLAQPSGGTYILDGVDVGKINDRQLSEIRNEKIGFVFQSYHLLPGVSALDNVMMPLLYSRKLPPDAEQRAREALAKVGMGHRLTHTSGQLSGGEQQRVTIARALVNNPKIVLADEPTGNLDSENGAIVMETFDKLNREGRTLLLITHEPEVARHARRILTIKDGLIESDRMYENSQKLGTGPAWAGTQ